MGKIVKFDPARDHEYKPDYFSPDADLIAFDEPRRRAAVRARRSKKRYQATKKSDAPFIHLMINLSIVTFIAVWAFSDYLPSPAATLSSISGQSKANASDTESAQFSFCHVGGGTNCVVDGDTFWYEGERVRIADIDTPETHPPRCAEEARIGNAATQRLHSLLNAGPFRLETVDRNRDTYGRLLRNPTRAGQSLGSTLVSEGLARDYGSGRRPWC